MPFTKGTSGNPNGRPHKFQTLEKYERITASTTILCAYGLSNDFNTTDLEADEIDIFCRLVSCVEAPQTSVNIMLYNSYRNLLLKTIAKRTNTKSKYNKKIVDK